MALVARHLPNGVLVHIGGVPVRLDRSENCPKCGRKTSPVFTTDDAAWDLIQVELARQHAAREAAADDLVKADTSGDTSTAVKDRALAQVDAKLEHFSKRQVITGTDNIPPKGPR